MSAIDEDKGLVLVHGLIDPTQTYPDQVFGLVKSGIGRECEHRSKFSHRFAFQAVV